MSVAQSRHHFQNIMLGLADDEPIYKEEYEVPTEQRVKRNEAGEIVHGSLARGSPARSLKGKEKEKGKRKSSLWNDGHPLAGSYDISEKDE
ncbi:hypothetical protein SLS60_004205 [Paraconiothyrium brasiliense]|uniref:Uncharacterized protein n=1 Tax=Paraconiothyrium brasiliense TaxID=300254 RepID=A0ABR3RR96_9PLEO